MLSRRKYQITVALILKFVSKHLESLPVLQEVRRQAGIGDVPILCIRNSFSVIQVFSVEYILSQLLIGARVYERCHVIVGYGVHLLTYTIKHTKVRTVPSTIL